MLSRSSLAKLSTAERHLLRRQWQQSGQCFRCFHASRRQDAEEGALGSAEGNDQGTPYNKSPRGLTRHQRAAQISEEVRLLNREVPSLGHSKPPTDSADFAVGLQGTGELATPGRMGENMPPTREGPMGQGVGRLVRSQDDVDVGGQTQQIRGTRSPAQGVEDPTQGGASLMEGKEHDAATERIVGRPGEEDFDEREGMNNYGVLDQSDMVTRPQSTTSATTRKPRISPPGLSFQPPTHTIESLTKSGTNTATIAAANFEGVLNDRIRSAFEPGRDPAAERDPKVLAQRLLENRGGFRFSSKEEQEEVLTIVRTTKKNFDGAAIRTEDGAWRREDHPNKDSPGALRSLKSRHFHPLPEAVQKSLVENFIGGVYDPEGMLQGKQVHRQPVLNDIARMGLRNGTYLASDAQRVLKKVQSLLPAGMGAAHQGRAAAAGGKSGAATARAGARA